VRRATHVRAADDVLHADLAAKVLQQHRRLFLEMQEVS
jgi:hypothetical protein